MEHATTAIFPRNVTKEQCKDTGMALVLLLLISVIVCLNKDRGETARRLAYAAMALHVVNMIAPRIYHWPAVVWFGLSHILGAVVSKVVLTLVFLFVVTPIAVVRRAMGKDPMQLKAFKSGSATVMVERNHTFAASDISKPY